MLPQLYIKANGVLLDLPEDAAISLSFNNPWIDKPTDIKASFSFPFTLPATPNNVKELDHPYRINKANGLNTVIDNIVIGYSNTQLFSGVFLVTNASERGIEVSFGVGNSNFYSKVATKTLPDLFVDEYITPANDDPADFLDVFIQSIYQNADVVDYVCAPFYNWRFYNDDITTNYITEPFQNFMHRDSGGNYYFASSDSIVTPFLYLKYVLERLCSLLGFNLKSNFLYDDAEFRTLTVYNNYDANGYDLPLNKVPIKELLPSMLADDFITSIQNLLNVFFDFSLANAGVSIIDIEQLIVSGEHTDWTEGAEAYPVVSFAKTNDGYTLEHAVDNNEALGSTFSALEDNKEFTVLDPVDLVADLTTGDPIFSVRYVYNTKKYYIYSTPNPATAASWTPFVFDKSVYKNAFGEFVVKSNIATFTHGRRGLVFEYDVSGLGTGFYTAMAELNGNSIYNNGNRKEFGLHLMFFRGEQITEQGGVFPALTCDTGLTYDFDPDQNYALTWDHPTPYGDKGLKTTRYKNYLYWYFNERKLVKYRRYCSIADLQKLSFAKKYRINQTNYFIQQLNVTLRMYSIDPAELTLAKV